MLAKRIVRLIHATKCNYIRQIQTQHNVSNEVSLSPVMVRQLLEYLKPAEEETIIDMTFGSGGHSRAILEQTKTLKIIALDRDPACHAIACEMSEEFSERVTPLLGTFSDLPNLLNDRKIGQNSIDGIIFDFGCSTLQLDNAERGFTTKHNGPLDMRMDHNRCKNQCSAKDILQKGNEDDLGRLFKIYGEEKHYKALAAAVVQYRQQYGWIETTGQLCSLVEDVLGKHPENMDIATPNKHPASKIFQALRMFVNNELNEINYGMLVARKYLKIGGKLIALTFNNLEDTIVKRHIAGNTLNDVVNKQPLKYVSHSFVSDLVDINDMLENNWQSLTQHIVCPSLVEVEENPRNESAGLRAAIKVK